MASVGFNNKTSANGRDQQAADAIFSKFTESCQDNQENECREPNAMAYGAQRSIACPSRDKPHQSSASKPVYRRSPKRIRSMHYGGDTVGEEPHAGSHAVTTAKKRRCVLANQKGDHIGHLGSGPRSTPLRNSKEESRDYHELQCLVETVLNYTTKCKDSIVPVLSAETQKINRVTPKRDQFAFMPSDLVNGNLELIETQVSYLLAQMMPTTHVKTLGLAHLYDLNKSCEELGPVVERIRRTDLQVDPKSATRRSLVKWMSDVSSKMRWTIPSCYSAIATLDAYVTLAQHQIPLKTLPKIAATCLYYASQMQETAVDDTILPVDRFLSVCPEICTAQEFLDHQVHLVDTLQGVNFCRKTPFDYLMLYLARLQLFSGVIGESLYRLILQMNFIPIIMEAMHAVNLSCYYGVGLNRFFPESTWVYCGLYHTINHLLLQSPQVRDAYLLLCGLSYNTLSCLCEEERELMTINLVKAALLEATHLACDGSTCSGSDPVSSDSVTTSHYSDPHFSPESSGQSTNCTEAAHPQFVNDDMAKDALLDVSRSQEECSVRPVIEGHLIESANITETLFVGCVQLIIVHSKAQAISTKNGGQRTFELPSSAILNLKYLRKSALQSNSLPGIRGRKTMDNVTIDCIRPQSMWIHHHPDRLFAEFDQRYRKDVQLAMSRCYDSLVLLDPRFHLKSNKNAQSCEGIFDDAMKENVMPRSRRASVCTGMPENVNKRASIQAPMRILK